MLEIKTEESVENEAPKEIEEDKELKKETTEEESVATETAAAAAVATEAAPEPPPPPPPPQAEQNTEGTLNPLNEQESIADSEGKTKHRRYWTPKEEERFYEIWGRENWRLTRHGKNTIFFAKWADEMRDRFNIDIKPEEIQCKVNQTRAKFRQVKKHLDSDKNAIRWKKYDIIEKILKNQYRSKDDEPVPLEALENNRDVSPTELHNTITQPPSPNNASNMPNMPEQNINLNQSLSTDHQLTDEVNMSSASLSDQNLFCNNSQSGNSFSTELFGSDQLEIKQEIENDIKLEGFTELTALPNEQNNTDAAMANNVSTEQQPSTENQANSQQHLTQQQQQQHTLHQQQAPHATENEINALAPATHHHSTNPNSLLIQNRVVNNHSSNNNNNNSIHATADGVGVGVVSLNNHVNANSNTMQPPPKPAATHTPRKRNRTTASAAAAAAAASGPPVTSDNVEAMYMEEVKKRNVLLVEQGEINRKRLRLEERKVKLMEEFFPKFMNLQQEILQKLDSVTNATTQITN